MGMEQFSPWKPALQKHSPGLLQRPLTQPPHTAVKVRMINEKESTLGAVWRGPSCSALIAESSSPTRLAVALAWLLACALSASSFADGWRSDSTNQIEDSRVEQAAPVQPSVQTSHRAPVAVGLQVQTLDAVHSPFTHSGSQAAGK
jgi:hypothetical protein